MARILFISDIHGNHDALHAILEEARYDEVICLGDLVDYGPEPAECIDTVRSIGAATVRGNHDNAVAYKVDCGCSYEYKHLSEATREYTWASIDDGDMAYLKGLPVFVEKEVDGIKIAMAHGSSESFFDYVYPEALDERIDDLAGGLRCEFLALGHTHRPYIWKQKITVLNPGSVGQPRDGDIRASCIVLDTKSREARLIRIKYDLEAVCMKVRDKMPYSRELIAILKRGY